MEKGAKLQTPQEPIIVCFSEKTTELRKELVEKIIGLFSESGLTFDESYRILEITNETLMYRSRFVRL
ncbi:hypothetical protein [Brevibacillus borstelensis]|uniref:hypothetical protein n=1 Tax=Brevibacillus borstelensis TaxID=45462 RepID=UPI00046AA69B|nr:hypothetical protein [Brevibacillus borstelensis]